MIPIFFYYYGKGSGNPEFRNDFQNDFSVNWKFPELMFYSVNLSLFQPQTSNPEPLAEVEVSIVSFYSSDILRFFAGLRLHKNILGIRGFP